LLFYLPFDIALFTNVKRLKEKIQTNSFKLFFSVFLDLCDVKVLFSSFNFPLTSFILPVKKNYT
jgi:hypothetical protein